MQTNINITNITKLRLILHNVLYSESFIKDLSDELERNNNVEIRSINSIEKSITLCMSKDQDNSSVIRDICSTLCGKLNANKIQVLSSINNIENQEIASIFTEHILLGEYVHLLLDLYAFNSDDNMVLLQIKL